MSATPAPDAPADAREFDPTKPFRCTDGSTVHDATGVTGCKAIAGRVGNQWHSWFADTGKHPLMRHLDLVNVDPAPAAASDRTDPTKRVTDEQMSRDVEHARAYRLNVDDEVMLSAGYPADLRDARADNRAKDTEIERLNGLVSELRGVVRDSCGNTLKHRVRAERTEAAVAEMRERCAKVAETASSSSFQPSGLLNVAAAIRALPLPNETAEDDEREQIVEAGHRLAKRTGQKFVVNPPPQSQDQDCGGDDSDAALAEYRELERKTDGYCMEIKEPAFRAGFIAARRAAQPSDAVAAVERLRDSWLKEHNGSLAYERKIEAANEILMRLRTLPSAPEPAQQPVMPYQRTTAAELDRFIRSAHGGGIDADSVALDLRDLRRAWPGTLDRAIEVVEKLRNGFDHLHQSLMGLGPKQACGEQCAYWLSEADKELAALRAGNTGSAER